MEDEVRNAPPTMRTNMNSRVTGYKSELLTLKRSVVRESELACVEQESESESRECERQREKEGIVRY